MIGVESSWDLQLWEILLLAGSMPAAAATLVFFERDRSIRRRRARAQRKWSRRASRSDRRYARQNRTW